MLSAPTPTFFEQFILALCAEAILGNRELTDAQKADVLSFVATHDSGKLGRAARKTLVDAIADAISCDDVLTPKPLLVIVEPTSRSNRRGHASTDVMRGFGAGFFMVRKGQA